MTKYTEDQISEIIDQHEFLDEELIRTVLADEDLDHKYLLNLLDEFDSKHWAVFEHCGEDLSLIEKISDIRFSSGRDAQCDYIEINGEEIRVMDDYEADKAHEAYLEELVEDSGCPNWLQSYIDYEQLIKDSDRGQNLSGYDGCENEYNKYSAETIYIYRNN